MPEENLHTIVVKVDRQIHDDFRDEMKKQGLGVAPGVRLLMAQWVRERKEQHGDGAHEGQRQHHG
jgi:hypothetical protein